MMHNEMVASNSINLPSSIFNLILEFLLPNRDGRALLVRPSRIPHRISKIIFALGADKFLAMLEGKTREAPFI